MESRPEPFSWWVAFRNPAENYRNHPTYLVPDVIYHVIAALLLAHALRRGGRYPCLYFSALAHGVFTEVFSYWVPQINNFWHGHATVMFAGQRLPSYIVCQYIAVIYTSSVAAARLRLGLFATACATALTDSLYYHVFDVTGVKMLWWSWHDTDPNVYDRTYWVPWGSPYWRLSFASSFTLLFHGVHGMLGGQGMFQKGSLVAELGSAAVAVFLTFPVGVATQFIPLFHVVKDILVSELGSAAVAVFLTYPVGVATQFVPLFHVVKDVHGERLVAELGSAAVAVFLTFPVGVATQFIPLFHVVKDVLGVHAKRQLELDIDDLSVTDCLFSR
ncbi:uncharacterized protein [Branchiostoma lanceolatum]|uniref:uncharacterized protein n=1 Tax=Branchiostoma lanceolatum TaxID=7740 RepID=UPI0034543D2B